MRKTQYALLFDLKEILSMLTIRIAFFVNEDSCGKRRLQKNSADQAQSI